MCCFLCKINLISKFRNIRCMIRWKDCISILLQYLMIKTIFTFVHDPQYTYFIRKIMSYDCKYL